MAKCDPIGSLGTSLEVYEMVPSVYIAIEIDPVASRLFSAKWPSTYHISDITEGSDDEFGGITPNYPGLKHRLMAKGVLPCWGMSRRK